MVCCKFIALWKSREAEAAQHRDAACTAPFLASQGQHPLVTQHCHLCSHLLRADILQFNWPSVTLGCVCCIHKGRVPTLGLNSQPLQLLPPQAGRLQELLVSTACPVSATLNISGAD